MILLLADEYDSATITLLNYFENRKHIPMLNRETKKEPTRVFPTAQLPEFPQINSPERIMKHLNGDKI